MPLEFASAYGCSVACLSVWQIARSLMTIMIREFNEINCLPPAFVRLRINVWMSVNYIHDGRWRWTRRSWGKNMSIYVLCYAVSVFSSTKFFPILFICVLLLLWLLWFYFLIPFSHSHQIWKVVSITHTLAFSFSRYGPFSLPFSDLSQKCCSMYFVRIETTNSVRFQKIKCFDNISPKSEWASERERNEVKHEMRNYQRNLEI